MLTNKRQKITTGIKLKDDFWGYVFIGPWVIGFLVFTLYPMIKSLYMSFFDWDLFGEHIPIGIQNYIGAFTNDAFKISLSNTLIYAILSTAISIIFGIIIAYVLLPNLKRNIVLRTIIYMPCLVIGIAFAMMMAPIFDGMDSGLINQILLALGRPAQTWLTTQGQAIWVLIVMSFWGLGGPMIIFTAALKNVDNAVLEAARIDGASRFGLLTRINIPIITPIIIYQTLTGIIYGLQIFDLALGLATASGNAANGMGLNNSLGTLSYLLFRTGFNGASGQMGMGSAIGWMIFLITAVFSIAILWFINKSKYYSMD